MVQKIGAFLRSALTWMRVEIKFVLLVVALVIAALASLTYAYSRTGTVATVTDLADAQQTRELEQFLPAEVEAEPSPATDDSAITESAQPKDSTIPGPGRPSGTLGAQVDCAQINVELGRVVQSLQKKLSSLEATDLEGLYRDTISAYETYRKEVLAKGCEPSLSLPKLPERLLKPLLPQLF